MQFIELTALTGGQQFLTGHTITSTMSGSTQTVMFNANIPGDTGGKTFLIGTAAVAALSGVTPDYIMPSGFLFTTNGMLNFAEGADAWSYTALPVNGTDSLLRSGGTALNSPRNFAGVTGTVTLPGPPAVGTDFDGDGKGDLLLRNKSTGQNIGWLMNGLTVSLLRVPADDCRHELGDCAAAATSTATARRTSSGATSPPARTSAG